MPSTPNTPTDPPQRVSNGLSEKAVSVDVIDRFVLITNSVLTGNTIGVSAAVNSVYMGNSIVSIN